MAKNKYMRDCRKRRKLSEKQKVKKAQRSPVERAYDRYICARDADVSDKSLRRMLGYGFYRDKFRTHNKKQQLFEHWQKLKEKTNIQTA